MTVTATHDYIDAPAQDDWSCICGNFVGGSGFYPCLADGTYVEPLADGPWDGKLVRCDQCGRIMDQSTWDGSSVAVVGRIEA